VQANQLEIVAFASDKVSSAALCIASETSSGATVLLLVEGAVSSRAFF